MKLIYLHSSYRTNLKPREGGEEKMKFSFWRCFSIFVRWPHKTLLFTPSLLISSEKYSTTFCNSYVLESHFEIVFIVVNKRGLLRDMCDTKLVLRIGLKTNMHFRVNDNIPGFFFFSKDVLVPHKCNATKFITCNLQKQNFGTLDQAVAHSCHHTIYC